MFYSITSKGKTQFYLWTNSPIENSTPKNSELAKIYFMGFTEKDNRVNMLESHIADLQKLYKYLERNCNEGAILATELQENDILFYQMQTANYGCDLMRFNIDWYSRLLETIRRN